MALIYQSLNKKDKNIRLLDVHPAAQLNDPLEVTLRHARLHESVYSALSYVWGNLKEGKNESDIFITYERSFGGKFRPGRPPKLQRYRIGGNLSAALRYVRQRERSVTIWADALCINQEDKEEKSWQVLLMLRIYEQATTVIAFLGPQYDDDATVASQVDSALDLVQTIWNFAQKASSISNLTREGFWLAACFAAANPQDDTKISSDEQRDGIEFANELRSLVNADHSLKTRLREIAVLSRREYFTRIWILQETGRARDLVFRYGDRQVSYRPAFLALSLASSLGGSRDVAQMHAGFGEFDKRFLGCISARTTCMHHRSIRDVLELAYFASPPLHRASRPEDLVYGRLGLASDLGGFKVDYGFTVAEVYIQTARFLLEKGSLDLLVSFKPYKFLRGDYTESLPSWVYDWTRKGFDHFARYEASKGTTPQLAFVGSLRAGPKDAVEIKGVHIGQVQLVGRRFSAMVMETGFSQEAVATGSLWKEPATFSAEQKHNLVARINSAYEHLGTSAPDKLIEQLFSEQRYPLARFWSWWLNWIADLQKVINAARSQFSDHNVEELLFREAFRILNRTPAARLFRRVTSLLQLVDLSRWMTLLSSSGDPGHADDVGVDDSQDFRSSISDDTSMGSVAYRVSGERLAMTPFGVSAVESFYRSGLGMRFIMLDTERLGHVPEDSLPRDQVVIFHGAKAPLVIRKVGDTNTYRIIGPAHICGVMEGQLMEADPPTASYVIV